MLGCPLSLEGHVEISLEPGQSVYTAVRQSQAQFQLRSRMFPFDAAFCLPVVHAAAAMTTALARWDMVGARWRQCFGFSDKGDRATQRKLVNIQAFSGAFNARKPSKSPRKHRIRLLATCYGLELGTIVRCKGDRSLQSSHGPLSSASPDKRTYYFHEETI